MKTAIVTASTKGIGKAIAMRLLNEGCFVIMNYSSDDQAAVSLKEEINEQLYDDSKFIIIKACLSSMDGLEAYIKKINSTIESIDYLVLNTALTDKTEFENITFENWQRVLDTNVSIPFFTIQKLSHKLTNGAKIVLIGSIMGVYPHAISIAYGVSKAALHFLGKSLVKVFSKRQITINIIAPGFVDTTWQENKDTIIRRRIEDKTALHRFASPIEVADICSSVLRNGYINGSIIIIDGGYCYK